MTDPTHQSDSQIDMTKVSHFRWRRVYGLGFAFERINLCDDRLTWRQQRLSFKLFLGPLLVLFDVPIERKKDYLP